MANVPHVDLTVQKHTTLLIIHLTHLTGWVVAITLLTLLMATRTWAFKPAIHEDVSSAGTTPISRDVGGETLEFAPKAIIQIRKANRATDLSIDFFRSFKHFDSETFRDASQHLVNLKNSTISKVTASSPDGEKARGDLGTALHTLQDFYAHSNWIEIGRTGINTDLGVSVLDNPSPSTAFCPGNPEVLGGAGLTQLTTGYYEGLLGVAICDLF